MHTRISSARGASAIATVIASKWTKLQGSSLCPSEMPTISSLGSAARPAISCMNDMPTECRKKYCDTNPTRTRARVRGPLTCGASQPSSGAIFR